METMAKGLVAPKNPGARRRAPDGSKPGTDARGPGIGVISIHGARICTCLTGEMLMGSTILDNLAESVDEKTKAERPSRCPPGGVMPRLSTAPRGARPEPHPQRQGGFLADLGARLRARRERQSRRLSLRPRRAAGPATPSSPSFVCRLPRAAAGLLLAFAALLALPLQAQAQTVTTLVSNTQTTLSEGLNYAGARTHIAQSFVVGSVATLTSVEIHFFEVPSGGTAVVTLHSPDILYPSNPGTKVADLTLSGTLSAGANTFNAPADTELSTGTYFVVVEKPLGTGPSLRLGAGNNPETTALTGWSIADNLRHSVGGTSWSNWLTPFSMAVKGISTTTTNTAAMGQPSISGTAQVGQTLTASTSGIMDADLLPASFTYQWVRVGADGTSNETNIGSNASTYTPSSSDVGNRIKVKVSFTDGAGNPEGPLTSDAYPSEPPGATVVAAQGSCPSDNDWCATLTMGYDSSSSSQSLLYDFGFISGSNFGVLAPAMFTRGPTAYTVTEVYRVLSTSLNGNTILGDKLTLRVSGGTLPDGTVLNVGGTELTVGTDTATTDRRSGTLEPQGPRHFLRLGRGPEGIGEREARHAPRPAARLHRPLFGGPCASHSRIRQAP